MFQIVAVLCRGSLSHRGRLVALQVYIASADTMPLLAVGCTARQATYTGSPCSHLAGLLSTDRAYTHASPSRSVYTHAPESPVADFTLPRWKRKEQHPDHRGQHPPSLCSTASLCYPSGNASANATSFCSCSPYLMPPPSPRFSRTHLSPATSACTLLGVLPVQLSYSHYRCACVPPSVTDSS